MAKFCPECVHPIIDGNMPFCPKCGAKLLITSSAPQPTDKQKESQKPEPEKNRLFDFLGIKEDSETKQLDMRLFGIDKIDDALKSNGKNKPLIDISELDVILGVLIILALYIFPISSFQGRNFSIADLTSICNSPIGIMVGGSGCNMWNMVFYGGWAFGIYGIIFGIVRYSKKK